MASPWTRERTLHLALGLVLTALPFALVTFPPCADLPQQAAQIRLLEEQLGLAPETAPRALYAVRWWAPNNLVYAIFFSTARVLEPIAAARAALAILALLAVLAIHDLARRRARPAAQATLASTFVFSLSLYWGFVAFLFGAALFLATLDRALAPPSPRRVLDVLTLAGLATLLYLAHSFWLPALALALALGALLDRRPPGGELPRALAFVPAALHAAVWFPLLRAERGQAGFDLAARWRPLGDRLSLEWLPESLYGGLRGTLEPAMTALVLVWVAAGLIPARDREARGGVDRALLALGAALLAFAALAPDKYVNTIAFNTRFVFVGAVLVVLAAPRPPFRAALAGALPAAAAIAFATTTAARWVVVDREELSGLHESVRVAPGPARVIGLDFLHRSDVLDGTPFLHAFAWRQALWGGALSFSFAEHRSGIVGMRGARQVSWTPGLEWLAERVTHRDLAQFDLALVAAPEAAHAGFVKRSAAEPLLTRGRFRLYRLAKPGR